MKTASLIVCLFSFGFLAAQEDVSQLWKDFVKARETGGEPILPDFSYAGYRYSEEAILVAKYKEYNIVDFGGIPNDGKTDKAAMEKAIRAASDNGEGIIFFPKGKYHINTAEDGDDIIIIPSSKIIFRGEGNRESTLFFEKDLPPKDPEKLWTVPYAIETEAKGTSKLLANVTADARRETFEVQVDHPSNFKKGDWIVLKVRNNSKDLVEYDLRPAIAKPEWTSILEKGVVVNEHHQVMGVNGNIITFFEPIHYDVQKKHGWTIHSFPHLENIGFENLVFEGNWARGFEHHRSAQDDGGWSILNLKRVVNSWIKDCSFKNVSNAAKFSISAASTALNINIEGNPGHSSISAAGGSTGVLLANINDEAGMWHSAGVGGGSTTGTVIWRSKHPANTSFESHASQPRVTLFDLVEGGFFLGRAGGARQNLPNHGRYLVLWNYEETDQAEENFEFWSSKTWYWKIVPPIVVGFHGSGTTFKKDEIQVLESQGKPVDPASLFEAQLELRLGELPNWIVEISKELN